MKSAIILASFVGFLGSVLAIVLGYIDYGMLSISVRESLQSVWKWPVFSMPLFLTAFSLSVPFVAHFFRTSEDPQTGLIVYAFVYLWFPLLIFYPGTRALGITSDGALVYTSFGVCVAQYLAAKIVLKAINMQAVGSAV